MAEYKSNPVALHKSAEQVYNTLTDLRGLGEAISGIPHDQVPEDKLQMLEGIKIDDDSMTIPGGPTGAITLRRAHCTPYSEVSYEGVGTPVPVSLAARIQSTGPDSCEVTVEAAISVPAIMKPMLNGPMNKMVNEVAANLTKLNLKS